MKIQHIILASAVLVSVSAFAQKDELKTLKKIYAKDVLTVNDLAEYKTTLTKLEPIASEESDKVYTTFYKCMLPILNVISYGQNVTPVQLAGEFTPKSISEIATGLNLTLDFEKKSGKKVYTDDIIETITSYKSLLVNFTVSLAEAKKYKEAGDVLYSIYQLDKKDQDKLYYAAYYAVSGLDYDKALSRYNELKTINYTGEATLLWAMNKTTKKEESFNSKTERELFIKTGTHEKPRDEKLESKRGEIYKNIAFILIENGKIDEAKAAVAEARKASPDDNSLILTEADLYLKVKDYDNYTRLVNESLAKDPTNAILICNLGIISSNANKLEEAEKYYLKALQINPNYFDALLNLSELKLRADDKFVTEMNKLGTSEKDNKRYDVIKGERANNFKAILPYLEKAVELKGDNEAAKKTLLSVYNFLEMTDKAKALKAKM